MTRWNFFFRSCEAISSNGRTVKVPTGHGMVTLADDASFEEVFFPGNQLELKLLPGEVRRLEHAGLAERYGPVR